MIVIAGPLVCRWCGMTFAATLPLRALCEGDIECPQCGAANGMTLGGVAQVLPANHPRTQEHLGLFCWDYYELARQRALRN